MKSKLFIAVMGSVLLITSGALTGLCGDVAAEVATIDSYDLDFGHYTDSLQPSMMQAALRDDYDMDYGRFTDGMEPSLVYAAFIADYLEKCDCRGDMLDAKSLNIRKAALRDTVKGAYVEKNSAELVRYMVENNVPMNPRRVEYVINQRFADQVNPQEVYTVLTNE